MRRTVVKRPLAEQGILAEAKHIALDKIDAALRFIDAVEESLKFLAEWPDSGEKIDDDDPELAGTRIWQVSGFENYLIVFRLRGEVIEVLHVFQGSRKMSAVLREIRSQN